MESHLEATAESLLVTSLAAVTTKTAVMESHLREIDANRAERVGLDAQAKRFKAVEEIKKDLNALAESLMAQGVVSGGAETLDQTKAHSVHSKK